MLDHHHPLQVVQGNAGWGTPFLLKNFACVLFWENILNSEGNYQPERLQLFFCISHFEQYLNGVNCVDLTPKRENVGAFLVKEHTTQKHTSRLQKKDPSTPFLPKVGVKRKCHRASKLPGHACFGPLPVACARTLIRVRPATFFAPSKSVERSRWISECSFWSSNMRCWAVGNRLKII